MAGYQDLDVYQCALQLLSDCTRLTQRVPKGYAAVGDQLRRAALSIPLNIAEGAGRPTKTDAARFYGIARGSATECGALIDALGAIGGADDAVRGEASRRVVRVVEMLTRMCR